MASNSTSKDDQGGIKKDQGGIKRGPQMIPWTFILQFIILTFNVSFLVHIMNVNDFGSSIPKGDIEEFLKEFWELLLISVLSIATTLRKFADFSYRHEIDKEIGLDKKLSKITDLVMMAMLASFVADLHYIPALVVAIGIGGGVSLLSSGGIILVLILAVVVFIVLEMSTRLEEEKRRINYAQVGIFGFILFIILFVVGFLSLGLNEEKHLIIAMAVGALIANTFGTIFVIWEKKLEGEKNEAAVSDCPPIGKYRTEIKGGKISIQYRKTKIEAEIKITDNVGYFYAPLGSNISKQMNLIKSVLFPTETIEIHVIDNEEDKVIEGAEIEIPELKWKLRTSKEGICQILLPCGKHKINVRAENYESKEVEIDVIVNDIKRCRLIRLLKLKEQN